MGIEVKNLSYTYLRGTPFERNALDNVSLDINDGEFTGIIGHTGCGKTTLIQHFNALLKPNSGSVLVDGQDVADTDLKKLRHKVGLVFQYPEHQLFEETVLKDVAFGIRKKVNDPELIREKVIEAIKKVGLDEAILAKSVFDLSGGQKRRVAIAGVLIMEPSILVLDEPAAGLDPSGRDSLYEILTELHDKSRITIVFVSHSMEDIALLCDRVIVMNKGGIYMAGSVEEIFRRSFELNEIGLDVPGITTFMKMLKKEYPQVDDDVYRLKDAKKEIIKLFRGERC
jgi:energy-coupling factor transport system ATP-binding protein